MVPRSIGRAVVFNRLPHRGKQILRFGEHVQSLVADHVDLIIVIPQQAQPLTEPVAKAYDAGIPVIALDRPLIGDKYTCFIHADDTRIGKAAGQWLVEKLGGKGQVVELMGPLDSTPSLDRQRGFAAAIKDYPDVDVVFKADMKWEQSTAEREMATALERSSNIAAVYAHNDAGAYGAYLAAKAAGRGRRAGAAAPPGRPTGGLSAGETASGKRRRAGPPGCRGRGLGCPRRGPGSPGRGPRCPGRGLRGRCAR